MWSCAGCMWRTGTSLCFSIAADYAQHLDQCPHTTSIGIGTPTTATTTTTRTTRTTSTKPAPGTTSLPASSCSTMATTRRLGSSSASSVTSSSSSSECSTADQNKKSRGSNGSNNNSIKKRAGADNETEVGFLSRPLFLPRGEKKKKRGIFLFKLSHPSRVAFFALYLFFHFFFVALYRIYHYVIISQYSMYQHRPAVVA
jgi:hypothetical protein